MCYDVRYLTKKLADYERRYGGLVDVEEIARKIDPSYQPIPFTRFHSSGFSHELLPVVVTAAEKVQFFQWGLIPKWIKSKADAENIQNKTLNARGEELFEKPSFKEAARAKRCILLMDGFYEHHHKQGKTFPYHIQRKDRAPMSMAGLWSTWYDTETGEEIQSVSIVTTKGNSLLAEIHNHPKLSGPRMPVLLDENSEKQWIAAHDFDQTNMGTFLEPYPAETLEAYPVRPLRGKKGSGNTLEATHPFQYPELQKGLFDM